MVKIRKEVKMVKRKTKIGKRKSTIQPMKTEIYSQKYSKGVWRYLMDPKGQFYYQEHLNNGRKKTTEVSRKDVKRFLSGLSNHHFDRLDKKASKGLKKMETRHHIYKKF